MAVADPLDNSTLTTDHQLNSQWFKLKIDAVKTGDRSAFRDLYSGTSGSLLRLAHNIVRDRALAEDVLQDAFVEIWSNINRYDASKGTPFAWMAGIVRHRALDRIRRESSQNRRVASFAQQPRLQLQADMSGLDSDLAKLVSCLQPLSKNQQEAILLAYYYGYSHQQIADRINSPIGSVKAWIRRALSSVRECMGL